MAALFTNNLVLYILIVLASLAGVGLLILGIYRIALISDTVKQRMQVFVDNRETTSTRKGIVYRVTPRDLPGSFLNRTIKRFFQRTIDFLGKYTPANSLAKLEYDLRVAGNPNGMHARRFYGIRVIILVLGMALGFLIYSQGDPTDLNSLLLLAAIILIVLLLPRLWLNGKIRRRKDELSHNLPDALDMLSVCATAGLSFDQGLKKICELWPTELSGEFKQVLQEMDMGVPRAEALRNLKSRINLDSLSSFIAIMIQAENTGMSYAEVLQSEAQQMRMFRQFRAKEQANTLPAKVIIPVAIFIFPALIAVILGPIIPPILGMFQ
jgi:tight adherence protein C